MRQLVDDRLLQHRLAAAQPRRGARLPAVDPIYRTLLIPRILLERNPWLQGGRARRAAGGNSQLEVMKKGLQPQMGVSLPVLTQAGRALRGKESVGARWGVHPCPAVQECWTPPLSQVVLLNAFRSLAPTLRQISHLGSRIRPKRRAEIQWPRDKVPPSPKQARVNKVKARDHVVLSQTLWPRMLSQ